MIIVQLKGGMGNQMFQFAVAILLAKRWNSKVLIDTRFFEMSSRSEIITFRKFELKVFDNDYKFVKKRQLRKFLPNSKLNRFRKKFNLKRPKIYREKRFGYDPELLDLTPPILIDGYFQTYKNFESNRAEIKGLFKFNHKILDSLNLKLLKQIENSNSVSVHIRRGDYVSNEQVNMVHGLCTLEYYLKAIAHIKKKGENLRLYFFSDDIDWVKKQFKNFEGEIFFVDQNSDENSWKDLLLMSKCKHNIIANSSFSWWGAWLNDNPGKVVICPNNWFKDKKLNFSAHEDLIPKEWKKI
jgi:hypothetical protein